MLYSFRETVTEWMLEMKKTLIRVVFLAVSLLSGIRSLQAGAEKGWDYFKKQEYALAAAEFERVLSTGAEDSATREGLGWCYYWLGRYDQAEKEFTRALELDPHSAGARNGLAEVKKWRYLVFNSAWQLFYNKDYVNALSTFRSILDDTSNRLPASDLWQVHSGIGWCYYYLQNYASAEKEFQTILGIYESNPFALKGLGFTQFQLRKYDDSISNLRIALKAHPEWADVQAMIGWNVYSKGDFNQALAEFQKALEINKSLADAVYGSSWCRLRMKQDAEALEGFRTAIRLTPYHPGNYDLLEIIGREKSWWNLYPVWGWSYYLSGDYASAEKLFTDAMTRIPDDVDLKRGKAFCFFKLGKYIDVVAILSEIATKDLKLEPIVETGKSSDGTEYTVRSDINSILAWSYYYLGELAKAQTMFEKEILQYPDWTDLYAGLGWCSLKSGKYEIAQKHLAKALEINPYYTVALKGMEELKKIRYADFNAAWSAYYAGDKNGAAEKFRAVAAGGLNNLDAKDRWQVFSGLGYSFLDLGKLPDAKAAFQKVLEMAPGNFYGYFGLAKAAYSAGNLTEARQQVEEALKVNSETADIWALKGWIFFDEKKIKEASAMFEK
jgi:tetratricopeptide (TPR) repeat protein